MIREELMVIQADMDDESPQVLARVAEKALAMGANDAHLAPLTMKKGRPGIRFEILCVPADEEKFAKLLLLETSTLGVKSRRVDRLSLERRFTEVTVEGVAVRVKLGLFEGRVVKVIPEYDDCAALSEKTGIALREILARVRTLAESETTGYKDRLLDICNLFRFSLSSPRSLPCYFITRGFLPFPSSFPWRRQSLALWE